MVKIESNPDPKDCVRYTLGRENCCGRCHIEKVISTHNSSLKYPIPTYIGDRHDPNAKKHSPLETIGADGAGKYWHTRLIGTSDTIIETKLQANCPFKLWKSTKAAYPK